MFILVRLIGREEGKHPNKGDLRFAGKRSKEQFPFTI